METDINTNFYTIHPRQHILFIQIFSAWDERVADQYLKDIETVMDRYFSNEPWAALLELRSWELNTPEAEKKIWDSNRNLSKPVTHVAFVVGRSETKKWQLEKMLKNVDAFKYRIFIRKSDAEQWLNDSGYNTTRDR